jgi:ABC-2 type transport system permease protein
MMILIESILAQCNKELKQFRRDPLGAIFAFVFPVVTLLIFGFAIRLEIKDVPLTVLDYDSTPLSRSYLESILKTNQFYLTNPVGSNGIKAIDRSIAKVAIEIPEHFARDLKENKKVQIQVLIDGIDVNNSRVIQNNIQAVNRFFQDNNGLMPPISQVVTHVRLWFNPGRKESLFIVPGVYAAVLFVYPSLLAALALVREKQQNTMVQVYSSGLKAAEFLLGKCLAYFFIAIVETIIVMILGFLIFGVMIVGDPFPLLVGTPLFLLTGVIFGLLLGVLAKQPLDAIQYVLNIGLLSSIWLSGFIYSIDNLPLPLMWLSTIIPARYYIELTRDAFVVGQGWSRVWYVPIYFVILNILMFFAAWKKISPMQFKDQ